MVFDITQLKGVRKQIGLTQHQFAQRAGISQSMVAKIEAGKLDPTYSYVKKIEEAIAILTKNNELKAEDIMTKTVIAVKSDKNVREIIPLFTRYKISQIPVIDDDIVGLITESSLLQVHAEDMAASYVEEIMDESPPVIAKSAQISVIKTLLRFYPIVMVKDAKRIAGVITKADLLKEWAKER